MGLFIHDLVIRNWILKIFQYNEIWATKVVALACASHAILGTLLMRSNQKRELSGQKIYFEFSNMTKSSAKVIGGNFLSFLCCD